MNAEITIGCDSFAAIATFIEFDRLRPWKLVNQGDSTIRAASDSWYIFSLAIWAVRHWILLSHLSFSKKTFTLKQTYKLLIV